MGRVAELGRLRAALDRTWAGAPGLCLIAGEAGIGKSRLLAEFTALAEARDVRVLAGGCVPLAEAELPFGPIIEALRRDQSGLDLTVAGSPSPTAQARMFELFLGTLGRLAAERPVLLAVEDVHWADQSTLDLMAFLARNLRTERVLLVLTCRTHEPDRSGEVRRRLPELLRLRQALRLDLPRLDRADTARQMSELLGGEPEPAVVDAVYARSEGNPLVTEAMVATWPTSDRTVPDSLCDFVLGRLATLGPQATTLLRVAAIAGREVRHDVLGALSGLDEHEVFAALREVIDAHVLVASDDGTGYRFRHALFREVVYGQTLPAERRVLHGRLAAALETTPQLRATDRAAHTAEIAGHWHAAKVPDRALPAAVRAGFDAWDRYAFAEALRHLRRALDSWHLVPDPAGMAGMDRAAIETAAADAAHLLGEEDQAVALAMAALGHVAPEQNPQRQAGLWNRIGEYQYAAGRRELAAEAFHAALATLPTGSMAADAARAMAGLAKIHVAWSDLDGGHRLAVRAIIAATSAGDRRVEGRARNVLGLAMAHTGKLSTALTELERSLHIARELDDPDDIAMGYINTGYVLGLAARFDDAARLSLEGYQEMRRLGLERQDGSFLQANAAGNLLAAGRLAEAGGLLAEAESRGIRGARAYPVLIYAARRLIWLGEFDQARRRLAQVGRLIEDGAVLSWHRWYLELVAEVAVWDGRWEQARAVVRDGLGLLVGTDEERFAGMLVSLGLRAEANLAEQARALRDEQAAATVRQSTEELLGLVRAFRRNPLDPADGTLPECAANAYTGQAELGRVRGASVPAAWRTAAQAWERLGKPFPAAYCTYRAAEAELARPDGSACDAAGALRLAHRAATGLGSRPLRADCERLARWHRVDLYLTPSAHRDEPDTLALTSREREILGLITEGRTNREIATTLVISPKTASVHVSNILRKLGVPRRTDAARIGHQLGLA